MVRADVQAAVEDVIRKQLSTVRIVSVTTARDIDFDGDDVLRITVLVDSPATDFDRSHVFSLIGHIRIRLEDLEEFAFPLVTFRSRQPAEAAT